MWVAVEKRFHRFVFGPVFSRRLGWSLGVRVVPLKTCSYDCVYCQLGRTSLLTIGRREWFPSREILREILGVVGGLRDRIDYVTFLGDGEPCLHSRLGWLIGKVKEESGVRVAVLTNGSLLWIREVREDLLGADLVSPKLDAGNELLWRRINRPHPGLSFDRVVEGLIEFRDDYKGYLWLEVMLVDGVNTGRIELLELAEKIKAIRPDNVFVNTPIRPPAESWVKPPPSSVVLEAARILGAKRVQVTLPRPSLDLSGYRDPVEAVVSVTRTHPVSLDELREVLRSYGYDPEQVVERVLSIPGVRLREYMGKYYIVQRG